MLRGSNGTIINVLVAIAKWPGEMMVMQNEGESRNLGIFGNRGGVLLGLQAEKAVQVFNLVVQGVRDFRERPLGRKGVSGQEIDF